MEVNLGHQPEEGALRDAVHVAVVPAKAATALMAGTPVRINAKGEAEASPASSIGVVDPFLPNRRVASGERFWLLLYPNTITGMRHHWQHPAFPVEDTKGPEPEPACGTMADSVAWVMGYVRENCPYWGGDDEGYNEFMRYVREDRKIFYYGNDCHELSDVNDADELFHHLSVILGIRIDASYFEAFTCSC